MYIVHKIHLATPRTVLTYTIVRSTFTYLTTMKDKDILKKEESFNTIWLLATDVTLRELNATKRYKPASEKTSKNFFLYSITET